MCGTAVLGCALLPMPEVHQIETVATPYQRAVQHLLALGHELGTNRKFDLDHMRVLAQALGNPQRRFASVLIAGTNGKGSTAATLASILQTAGHPTGLYTSPHLQRVNERIRVNGEQISDPELAEIHERVENAATALVADGKLPHPPSFFEMLTAMAFEYFASTGVEIAVLEVGMGGRLDATNIVDPCISVITDVALDHQQFLGNTVGEIAKEKAGIIREKGTVVMLPQHPEANDVLGNIAMERHAHAVSAVEYVPDVSPAGNLPSREHNPHNEGHPELNERNASAVEGSAFSYQVNVLGKEITVASPLIGRHQLRNTALAIAAAAEVNNCGFKVTAGDIERGIREARWPGRLQIIPGSPRILLDVAHNPAGAWALRSAISTYFEDVPLTILFGAMRDKAIAEMTQILFPLAGRVIATQPENPRAATPAEIAELAASTGAEIIMGPDIAAALERARAATPANGLVVVTGSIYLVGAVMGMLEKNSL
jgi:dihydrofolate synthase / folylpolyglutamate synthase